MGSPLRSGLTRYGRIAKLDMAGPTLAKDYFFYSESGPRVCPVDQVVRSSLRIEDAHAQTTLRV